jgi:hypothetical protein
MPELLIPAAVLWLVCGAVAATITASKGGEGCIGFAAGFFLGPFGIILAFFLGDDREQERRQVETGGMKKCPDCAELVKAEARICRLCRHEFQSEAQPASPAEGIPPVPDPAIDAAQEEAPASDGVPDTDQSRESWIILGGVGFALLLIVVAFIYLAPRNSDVAATINNGVTLDNTAPAAAASVSPHHRHGRRDGRGQGAAVRAAPLGGCEPDCIGVNSADALDE